jgi:hypothetical protein
VELGGHHDREAHEEGHLHDAAEPVQQVRQAYERVCDHRPRDQCPVDPGAGCLPAARPPGSQHQGDRYGTEFADARRQVHVLLKGKLETHLHSPAGRADLIPARFREDPADSPRRGKDHHGQPFSLAAWDAPGPQSQECHEQQQPGDNIGVLHRRGVQLAAHLEIAEELAGRAHEAGPEKDQHPPVVRQQPGDSGSPGHCRAGKQTMRRRRWLCVHHDRFPSDRKHMSLLALRPFPITIRPARFIHQVPMVIATAALSPDHCPRSIAAKANEHGDLAGVRDRPERMRWPRPGRRLRRPARCGPRTGSALS